MPFSLRRTSLTNTDALVTPPVGVPVEAPALHERGHGPLGDPEHRCGHAVGDGLGVSVPRDSAHARPTSLRHQSSGGPSPGHRHVSTSITVSARSSSSAERSWAARMSARASSLASTMSARSMPSRLAVGSTRSRCSSPAGWAPERCSRPCHRMARPHRSQPRPPSAVLHARHARPHRTHAGHRCPPSAVGTIDRPERLSGPGRALPIDDQGEHHHLVDGHGAHSVGPDASGTRLGMYLGTTSSCCASRSRDGHDQRGPRVRCVLSDRSARLRRPCWRQGCCPRIDVPGLLSQDCCPPGCCHQRCDHATARVTRPAERRSQQRWPYTGTELARQPQPEDQTGGQATGAALSHWLAPRPELTIKASTPSATSHHPADGEQGGGDGVDDSCGQRCPPEGRRPAPASDHNHRGPTHLKRPGRRRSRHAQSSRAALSTGRGVRRTAQPASTIRWAQGSWSTCRRPGAGC